MDAFDRVWAAYPRREAKKDARKAWGQVNADAHVDVILTALEWQRQSDSWKRGYVPLLATYLRGERWEDENPIAARVEAQQSAHDAKLRDWYAQWVKAQPARAEPVSFEGWKYAMEQRRRA